MELFEEIQRLIALGTEGEYWDFKELWHDNKASLLHDIICMANNQVGRDAYIIFGVSDSKSPDGVKIKGVQEANRKDQQHLIDFLRNKKFAGGVRPSVYLQTLEIRKLERDTYTPGLEIPTQRLILLPIWIRLNICGESVLELTCQLLRNCFGS